MSTLNTDQELAAEAIFGFLMGTNKEMSISGPPGVGKTWLIQHIVSKLMPYYRQACQLMGYKEVMNQLNLTATTNKAAEVLKGLMNHETSTIHSLLGLKVYDDYETGKQVISRGREHKVLANRLIIIDEASMIDRELYRMLQESTLSTCKIIYVGDHCQLAPVGEKLSPVFANPDIPTVKLLTPVRNANQPALMDLCAQLRATVETGIWKPIQAVPGVIEYQDPDTAMREVEQVFKTEGADARILAYTNAQVKGYNEAVRALRGYTARFHQDELVVNNTGIMIPGSKNFLFAEREFRVASVGADISDFEVGDTKIQIYQITLKDANYGGVVTVKQPVDLDHYEACVKFFKKNQMWREYYRLKNNFPDLRPRDASTVYKAQGSTFDRVYVDLTNIGTSNMADQAARMVYVAISRAKSKVLLYGGLPLRYAGA